MLSTPPMKICILGATGLVGRETLELVERAWPGAELDLYASRDQTIELPDGRRLPVRGAERLEQHAMTQHFQARRHQIADRGRCGITVGAVADEDACHQPSKSIIVP